MGYRIRLKESQIDIVVPIDKLNELFPKDKPKLYEWKIDKKGTLMIAALTEIGWIAFWAKFEGDKGMIKNCVRIYTINTSRSFYSQHGRYFLDKIEDLCKSYNGNLLLSTSEPETGGGRLTIIYKGKVIHGCFSMKYGSPYFGKSIWANKYNPEKDIEKEFKYTIRTI